MVLSRERRSAPQLGSRVVEPQRLREMRRLIASGRLTVLVPSRELKTQYDAIFDTGDVRVIALHVVVDDRYCVSRPASDYHRLSFSIVGDAMDGRKRQMFALAAFENFMVSYFSERPERYRNFTLSLIGVRESENAQRLKQRGEALLGDRFKIFPRMSPEAILGLTASLNATICCAEHEGFPLYVAKAMAMGHVLLRNDSGGSEEQLVDGLNGFAITDDTDQFAAMIERLLNREKTSNDDLQAMGMASQHSLSPIERTAISASWSRPSTPKVPLAITLICRIKWCLGRWSGVVRSPLAARSGSSRATCAQRSPRWGSGAHQPGFRQFVGSGRSLQSISTRPYESPSRREPLRVALRGVKDVGTQRREPSDTDA